MRDFLDLQLKTMAKQMSNNKDIASILRKNVRESNQTTLQLQCQRGESGIFMIILSITRHEFQLWRWDLLFFLIRRQRGGREGSAAARAEKVSCGCALGSVPLGGEEWRVRGTCRGVSAVEDGLCKDFRTDTWSGLSEDVRDGGGGEEGGI